MGAQAGMTLYDNHNRPLTYLRLSVTDRCNLRCFYCMPEQGLSWLPKSHLLTYEEIIRLVKLLARMGISKVRITGGEPFVRTDLMKLLRQLAEIPHLHELHLTTNGVLTAPYVAELKDLGIASVNLSLDTLDEARFARITRRHELHRVMLTLERLLHHNIALKINAVVMEGKNIEDIYPLAELTRAHKISVRFIEEMPFNGTGAHYARLTWNHKKILAHLQAAWPRLEKLPDVPGATATLYRIPGYEGTIGIIAAYSRTFCGTCNRIRITAQGTLKTCLYDNGVMNLRDMMRNGMPDEEIVHALLRAFSQRARNGFEAEARRLAGPVRESMATIGG
jgi:cyclic pyranopterin phosphate synthase